MKPPRCDTPWRFRGGLRSTQALAFAGAVVAPGCSGQTRGADEITEMQRSFRDLHLDACVRMRRRLGPSVTKTEVTRKLRAMKQAGIAGVKIQPVYARALGNPAASTQTLPLLSDPSIEAPRHVRREAHLKSSPAIPPAGMTGQPFSLPSGLKGPVRLLRTRPTS